jgi:hypothetical protein
VICATAGQLAAAEAVKRLLGLNEQPLAGEELAYCLLTHRILRTELPRNPNCRGRHRRWRQAEMPGPLADVTLSMLVEPFDRTTLQVRSDVPWIRFVLCPACARRNEVRRFARMLDEVGRCPCGEVLVAGPIGRCSVLPAEDLRACWETPLVHLGLDAGAAVGVAEADDWTYFFAAGETDAANLPGDDCHE